MSLKKEGNHLAKTLRLTTAHDTHDSSFERKFSLLLMENSFCDESDPQTESNIKLQDCKSDNSIPNHTPSNNVNSSKGEANSQMKSSSSQSVRYYNYETNLNCFPHTINYNLVLSNYPIQMHSHNNSQPKLQYTYSQAYLLPGPVSQIDPISPSQVYQHSYINNGSSSKEVLNIFDYFYTAFNIGQLASFLCNSQTCTAYPSFKHHFRGLSQPASDRMLDMIILSEGLDKIMTNPSSSPIIRSLLQTCSSNSRSRLVYAIKELVVFISQSLIGCQNLIFLIKRQKDSIENDLMQNLIAKFAQPLSTHEISYIIVIQLLARIRESNRPSLNNCLLKLFLPLVLHKYGVQVVSILLIIP